MKAINRHDFLRAIAFIVVTIFLVSCTSCCDEPVLKAVVTIQDARNVSATSATFVALVVANQDNTTITFEYNSAIDANWKTIVLAEKYNGSVAKEVTSDVPGLQPGVQYNYRAKALNTAGETISSLKSFTTIGLTPAIVTLKSAIVKIDSAVIVATLVPNQVATSLSVEYKPLLGTTWQVKSWPTSFSGNSLVTISFDITGLEANTDYEFRVKSNNVAGEVLSDVSSLMTYAVRDRDNNYYHTVIINNRVYLKENLRTTHYANGDPIANVINTTTWGTLTTGAYCWYNNDPKNGEVYGALYNWYVGADPRGLIIGWHVPTIYEWSSLQSYLGDYYTAGPKVMEAGNLHWNRTSRPATNSTGFTALPNGFIGSMDDVNFYFAELNVSATFWSSTLLGSGASPFTLEASNCWFNINVTYEKTSGFGVRLINN